MRSSTAYFAGAGTVIAALAVGLGGGYLFFSIVSPHPEKHGSSEVSRLERRMSPESIPAATKGPPEPVPYVTAPQVSAAVTEPSQPQPAPQQQQQAAQPQAQPQPALQQQAAQPQLQAPAQQQASTQPAAAPQESPPAAKPVAAADQPAAREKPEDAYAKARDSDVKRDARREAREERRKAERDRRQQWAERRKWRQRDDDGELVEVERKVREETESPRRMFASEPARTEMPRIRLFDMD